MSKSTEKFNLTDPIHFLALGFGSGLSPKAPGTMGTIAAIPVFLLMANFPTINYLAVLGVMTMFGIYICGKAASDAGVHDHGAIVWDEIVGYVITMILVPATVTNVLVGFVLFRIFDIFKPWPISWLDKNCHGGIGIMADDILAGVFACLSMHGLLALNIL